MGEREGGRTLAIQLALFPASWCARPRRRSYSASVSWWEGWLKAVWNLGVRKLAATFGGKMVGDVGVYAYEGVKGTHRPRLVALMGRT